MENLAFPPIPIDWPRSLGFVVPGKGADGAVDRLIESLPKQPAGKGKARQPWLIKPDRNRSLDHDFLEFLDGARRELASALIRQNDRAELLNTTSSTRPSSTFSTASCSCGSAKTGTSTPAPVAIHHRDLAQTHRQRRRRPARPPAAVGNAGRSPAFFGAGDIRAPKESLWRAVVRHFRALDRRPASHVPFF